MLLTVFDPWKSQFCTCAQKLTFNPYTGCDHGCVYCYASSYIPNFQNCRPKKDLLARLKREANKLNGELVSISNSSDPYPQLEQKLGLTRQCLEILAKHPCKLQIVTKSDQVTNDIDILQTVPSVVSVTVTTLDDQISRKLEPYAPVSSKRLNAIKKLVNAKIPTTARVDPIIPYVNDDPKELIKTLAGLGVSHVTSSTFKVKPDNWKRFNTAFSDDAEKLHPMYFVDGERIGGSTYLPRMLRFDLMSKTKRLAEKYGMTFGCCREGFSLNSAVCDGSGAFSVKK